MTAFAIGIVGYMGIALFAAFLDLTGRATRPVIFFALGAASILAAVLPNLLAFALQ